MSHLDHVVRVKEALASRGVTCPIKQRELCNNAYIDALTAYHFRVNPCFTLSPECRDRIRNQLERWNNVSPIGHSAIYNGVISRINLNYSSLSTVGCGHKDQVCVESEGGEFTLCELQAYRDLVAYLFQEVKGKHE